MRLSRLSDFDKLALAGLAGLGALAGAVALGVVTIPAMEKSLPLCLFRAVTGIPCPGCGMAHSLIYALNLRWADSWRAHPLGMPLLAAWLWRLGRAFARERLPEPRLSFAPAAAALSAVALAYIARVFP